MRIFSLYDVKAQVYGTPFNAINQNVATRMCTEIVNDEASIYYKHPEDFALFEIGGFDEETGELSPMIPYKITVMLALQHNQTFLESIGNGKQELPANGAEPSPT